MATHIKPRSLPAISRPRQTLGTIHSSPRLVALPSMLSPTSEPAASPSGAKDPPRWEDPQSLDDLFADPAFEDDVLNAVFPDMPSAAPSPSRAIVRRAGVPNVSMLRLIGGVGTGADRPPALGTAQRAAAVQGGSDAADAAAGEQTQLKGDAAADGWGHPPSDGDAAAAEIEAEIGAGRPSAPPKKLSRHASAAEMERRISQRHRTGVLELTKRLDEIDGLNRAGAQGLTLDVLREALKANLDRVVDLFRKMDADHSGAIDRACTCACTCTCTRARAPAPRAHAHAHAHACTCRPLRHD